MTPQTKIHRSRLGNSSISRRAALREIGLTGVSVGLLPGLFSCRSEGNRRRPNILVILADDWSWPHASVAGDSVVHTPNFDRICREGVLFDHAFAPAPSCAPSRAAMLTGRYHWELEQGANMWGTLPAQYPTYPEILEQHGYLVGFRGKGWGPGLPGAGGRAHNPAGPRYRSFTRFLRQRNTGQPFCFWLGSTRPHRPYKARPRRRRGLDPDKVRVPEFLPDVPEVRTDLCNYRAEVELFDELVGSALRKLEERGELDSTVVVVTSDNGMPFPRCKANLYDPGTRVPLAVRWEGIRSPGRTYGGFVGLQDLAPLFLELAGITPEEKMSGRSLLPVLEGEGLDPERPYILTGRERHIAAQKDSFEGYPSRAIRTSRYLYIRNYEPDRWPAGSPPAYRDVDRSPTKKFMVEHKTDPRYASLFARAFAKRPEEELYDLEKDPAQTANVAGKPEHRDIKDELAATLNAGLKRTDDPRAYGKGERFDEYPYYMLKRIYR